MSYFKESTKILTNKGYIAIQELRKGDLVKTYKNNYIPIAEINKREFYHMCFNGRIKDQLYKCVKNNYPEVFEDLIITGCNSILVDTFNSKKQLQKTIQINGKFIQLIVNIFYQFVPMKEHLSTKHQANILFMI